MTIRFADGTTAEGIILASDPNTMRVALGSSDDAVTFFRLGDVWTSEDNEQVEISYVWQEHSSRQSITEADCICSKELATVLLRRLFSEDERVVAWYEWSAWNPLQEAFANPVSTALPN
jgi:hypothetical protein